MTLTLDQLTEKVKPLYPEVQQIGDTVLRCIRKTEQSPFAVYYLDVGNDIPQTPDSLSEYLNHVVGKHYFEGSSSLQWNNYLYFIRNPENLQNANTQKAKEMVEQDRVYARKFVISESELDVVLNPKAMSAGAVDRAVDAISPWITILEESTLTEAVLGDHSLPKRMQLIEQPPIITPSSKISERPSQDSLLPQISRLEIQDFGRRLPKRKEFNFGAVNLLFGSNGAGKTSLLEAIELFYCGKTRRNPKTSEHYKFRVVENGKSRSVDHRRDLQPLRENNLWWYGVREERSTKLYDSFGKFNFLNSDAAIELSQSTDNIDDDLAKLLVGSEASKTWPIIQKLDEKIGTELHQLGSLNFRNNQELQLLDKQLSDISTIKKESSLYQSTLRDKLQLNQWMTNELELATDKLISDLAELKAATRHVSDFNWLEAPVTLDIISGYSQAVDSTIKECTPNIEKLKTLRINQQQLIITVKRDQNAIALLDELVKLTKSGIEQRVSELKQQRENIASYSNQAAGIDGETINKIAKANSNLSCLEFQVSATTEREQEEKALSEAKRGYDDFAKLRDQSLSLAQELREVAARILEDMPSDECPLCHTKFTPGELAHHIGAGVDDHLESKAQKMLEKIRRGEETVRITLAQEKIANQICSLCVRMQWPMDTELREVISRLQKMKDSQTEASKRAEILSSEILELEEQGLSLSRLNEVSVSLNELGINLEDRSLEKLSSIKNEIDQHMPGIRKKIEANSKEEELLKSVLSQALGKVKPSDTEPVTAMMELKERLVATRSVSTALNRFLPQFHWDGSRPIVEWMVEAESVSGIANQLMTALEKERVAANTKSEVSNRRDLLGKQVDTNSARTARLTEAKEAIKEILTKHSLEKMTKSALEENRSSIEAIFSKIHSPVEFKGIAQDWTLIREQDNVKTPLTKISTGQRAAFALAVFLAQNAKLQAGPQVILLDDPIAHIDDLNCLSFLDYLREIALTGKRQIFFATASSKLASLFERKFDFLGDDFIRFNLSR